MTESRATERAAPKVIRCDDLDEAIDRYQGLGFRLDALGPADEPTWAEMSTTEAIVLLGTLRGDDRRPGAGDMRVPPAVPELTIEHEGGPQAAWVTGRAGMRYRDLVPNRLGGAYIASHIHVPIGGPVPDYVHHHAIAYQLIFCHRGWVRVVYQDQGPPFVMESGDCVLQPPGIRHQVLESSDDLYVVEITCPAEHRTTIDHELSLPTEQLLPDRRYGGQRFVRHRSASEPWLPSATPGFTEQGTAIGEATDGLVEVQVIEAVDNDEGRAGKPLGHNSDFLFLFVVCGAAEFRSPNQSTEALVEGSSISVPPTIDSVSESVTDFDWDSDCDFELTEIAPGTRLLEIRSTVAASLQGPIA